MKILVTGGAGFIGKHLVNYLLKNNYNVTLFDNFSNSNITSVQKFLDKGITVIDGDIIKLNDIIKASEDQEIIIHLAAKISVEESIKNPSETFLTNVEGTKNVILACEKHQIKKLIIASSAAVYGECVPNFKLTEESNLNPISPYGESKKRMEEIVQNMLIKSKVNYIILRFFNIYGIGQSSEYAGVITKFMESIKNKKPLEIFGDGIQTRDFISIHNVIDSIHNAITNNKNGIFNIASGKIITIKKLAKLMISLSGKELDIRYLSSKKGDIKYSEVDISLAKKELKYNPTIELKDGIKELMNELNHF